MEVCLDASHAHPRLSACRGQLNMRATAFVECRASYSADGHEAYKSIGETKFVNGAAGGRRIFFAMEDTLAGGAQLSRRRSRAG